MLEKTKQGEENKAIWAFSFSDIALLQTTKIAQQEVVYSAYATLE